MPVPPTCVIHHTHSCLEWATARSVPIHLLRERGADEPQWRWYRPCDCFAGIWSAALWRLHLHLSIIPIAFKAWWLHAIHHPLMGQLALARRPWNLLARPMAL